MFLGEVEHSFLKFSKLTASNNFKNINNIAYKDEKGSLVYTTLQNLEENLDVYPFPDYSFDSDYIILDNQLDKISKKIVKKLLPRHPFSLSAYRIITSRGCPFSCSYCCNSTLRSLWKNKGKYVRGRSVENVIKEMLQIKEKLNIESFRIMDDSFLFYPIEWIKDFSNEYKKWINLPFSCRTNPLNIDLNKLQILAYSSLKHVQIGLQTGCEKINFELYNRKIDNKTFLDGIKVISNIKPVPKLEIDIIFDNPFETENDKLLTIEVLKKIPIPYKLGCFSLTFYPMTELYNIANDKGLISNKIKSDIYNKSYHSLDKSRINRLLLIIPFISNKLVDFLIKNKYLIFYFYFAVKIINFIKKRIKL